jgi:hypothetical protein
MTQLIDYKFGEDWDLSFTAWNDIETVRDEDVLRQKFILIAESLVGDLVGTNPTATELSRFSRRVLQTFRQNEYVDNAYLRNFEFDDGTMRFTLFVDGVEISDTATIQ